MDPLTKVGEVLGSLLRSSGNAIKSAINKSNEEFQKASEKASHFSDERLLREMREERNIAAKMAYAHEAKNRGLIDPSQD